MSFIDKMVADLITTVTTAKVSLTNSKIPKYIMGAASIALSGIILLIYVSYEPESLSTYHQVIIEYSRAYFTTSDERPTIALEANNGKYLIDYGIWSSSKMSGDEFINALNQSTQATLWLKSKNGVTGIKTPFIDISPAVGVAHSRQNRNMLLWLAGLFFAAGAFLIIVVRYTE
jgi:hypothetical protein